MQNRFHFLTLDLRTASLKGKLPLLFLLLMLASCHPRYAQQDIGDEVGEWAIQSGQVVPKGLPKDQLAAQYWNGASKVLPTDSLKKYVLAFRLYTDGPEGDLAGMSQINDFYWKLELDTADINFSRTDSAFVLEYHHTLIHEFGHLLTLNASQITPSDDEYQDDAKGYLTSEGYAKPNSYLDLFIERFWPNSLLNEWDKVDLIRNEKKRLNQLFQFYIKYANHFANDYAAESPEEDIAESWTYFVLNDKPKQDLIMKEKVRFFYDFPELLIIRNSIRAKLPFIPLNYLEQFERY